MLAANKGLDIRMAYVYNMHMCHSANRGAKPHEERMRWTRKS